MEEGNSTGSNFIWAIAMIVIVAMIVGAIYYSGFLSKATQPVEKKIDVKIETPATN